MADNNSNSGGVFKNWHQVQLQNRSKPLRKDIMTLMNLPRFPDYITDPDVYKLENIAAKRDVETEGKDLKHVKTFYRVKGRVEQQIDEILRDDLKPQDPFVEMAKNEKTKMREDDIDNQV